MSLQQSPTSDIEHAGVHNESKTSLHGRWLFIARAGWVALALLVLTLNASAVLRSRIYDIDTVINKALVYGLLSALPAAVYTSLIFTLQYLLHGIINQNNDAAIVVSTLTIATLFHPLRRRIQAIIDRRFYRQKYDATQIVETFSATLRNEVDLSKLSEHLIAVVRETMQPAHVSLWLHAPQSSARQQGLNTNDPLVQ